MIPTDLHFIRPGWLLALIPLAALLWAMLRRSGGASSWQGLVDPHLLPHLLERGGGRARRLAPWLLGLGWLLLVLALAGPTWERLPQPVYQAQQYRVLLLDISREMNAADVPPSRLDQARFETLDLLKHSDEGQTALIAYAAEPYVISPLTRDADTIALQVPALSSDLLPLQGRQAGPALDKALELLRTARAQDGEVILITGGMDDPAAAQTAARTLREAGHRLSVLAIGSEDGAPVPSGDGGFVQDANGAILLPRLDPDQLRDLAQAGGGRYVHSRPDDQDLDALLHEPLTPRQSDEQAAQVQGDQWREFGPWLLAALLPLAALAFRRGWFSPLLPGLLALGLGLVSAPQPARAFDWNDLWLNPDQQGSRALSAEQPEQAAGLFQDPAWRAAAHYRAGDYQQSLADLEGLPGSEPAYNRGNALARLGELEAAIAAYEQALEQDPQHRDAQYNRDLLRQLLDQQQEQQQQQSGDDGQSESSDEGASQQQGGDAQNAAGQSQEGEQSEQDSGQQETTEQGQEPSSASESQSDGEEGEQADPAQAQAADEAPNPGEPAGASEPGKEDLTGNPRDEPHRAAAGDPADGQPEQQPIPESAQAMEQWLRRVPDDPAGLLRQRILLQHLRNRGELP